MGINMGTGDQRVGKEKSTMSVSILGILETCLIVFLAVDLAFGSNHIAVEMQMVSKFPICLWAIC